MCVRFLIITFCTSPSHIVTILARHLCNPARAHDQYVRFADTLFFVNENDPTFNFLLPRKPVINEKKSEIKLLEKINSVI